MRSPEKEEARTHSIGQAADPLGVSVPTIRLYEREGLILLLRRDSGHRLYADTDIQRLHCIRQSITVYAEAADCGTLKSLLMTLTTTS
jgi:DNA-binding transcriptional MerR regulator